MTQPLQPLLVSVEEAAILMDLSPTTVWTMLRNGELTSVGGRGRGTGQRKLRKIERSEIDAWIARNRETTPL